MLKSEVWANVADLRQVSSVRRIALDDGPERGVRALAFSTGGGLDFWALSDRSLDIGPLSWRGRPIGWQSATGFRSPALIHAESDAGMGFMRAFSGLLVTCGLDHIGVPENGQPLHGRLPYTPARLLSYGEDWDSERPCLYCSGEIDQVRHLGEALRLNRRIEADIGGHRLRIIDRVTNLGAASQPHQLLYHINIGWPALDAGSEVSLGGQRLLPPFEPLGEGLERSTVAFPSGAGPRATCALSLPALSARLEVTYDAALLPVLQIWRDPRPRHRVLAIEPRSSERRADGGNAAGIVLEPGESRTYRVDIAVVEDASTP